MQNLEQILWGEGDEEEDPKRRGGTFVEPKRAGLRTLFVLLTIGVAGALPNFGFLTGLTGCFSNALLAFTLPPLFHLSLYWETLWAADGSRNWPVIVVNMLLICGGTVFSLVSTALLIDQQFDSQQ